jgi:DNA-binding transcriptional regulator WhiA
LTQNQSGATPWEFESPPRHLPYINNKKSIAYITGVALGDGNLSNPNGRATRLRITCDKKYPLIIENIVKNLKIIFPLNKVSKINKGNALDVSVYSNDLEKILYWRPKDGSKIKQKVGVPVWIKQNNIYIKECLRGLFQTDGSLYSDRGYQMVNFTSAGYTLVEDVGNMMKEIGFGTQIRKVIDKGKTKYVIRISKNVNKFIKIINFWKL